MRHTFLSFLLQSLLLVWIAVTHVQAIAGDLPEARKDEKAHVAAMTRQVRELCERGDYTKAIEAGKAAVSTSEKTLGAEDPWTGAAKRALAVAYLEVDDKIAASPLLRDAITILERADPPDVTALAYAMGDLAQTVASPKEAESLYRKALALAEEAVGPEHSATGHALNNLGWFLYVQDRAQEAEPLMRRAIHVRERTKGLADPLTAQSLCSLGAIMGALGDITIAESLVRRSLELRRTMLPRSHPDVAESCSRLAQVLLSQGKERAREATTLATEAFDVYRRSFGPNASRTLVTMHLKADSLALVGRQAESDRLHQELLAKLESVPASNLALLADALGDYGDHMLEAGKPDKAVDLYRRAIALQRKVRGDDDGLVVGLRHRLAEALYANVKIDDAVKEGREVLAALERTKGEPQSNTGVALYSLAKYQLAAGEMEEARALLRRSLAVLEKTTGRGSRETLQTIHLLTVSSIAMNEREEAERLIEDAFARFTAQDDVRTGSITGDLIGLRAGILRATGRIKEAEEAEAVYKQIEAEERRR